MALDNTVANFSHFDETGASRMVDVSAKSVTRRRAVARGCVRMQPATQVMLRDATFSKGNVVEVARLAGIMATKQTGNLIPLCHPLLIESVSVDFAFPSEDRVEITATVEMEGKTGVEMEALTAVSVAALTIYDMCKSVDKGMTIETIQLQSKEGGASGDFRRDA